jgi:hypothetical protein
VRTPRYCPRADETAGLGAGLVALEERDWESVGLGSVVAEVGDVHVEILLDLRRQGAQFFGLFSGDYRRLLTRTAVPKARYLRSVIIVGRDFPKLSQPVLVILRRVPEQCRQKVEVLIEICAGDEVVDDEKPCPAK